MDGTLQISAVDSAHQETRVREPDGAGQSNSVQRRQTGLLCVEDHPWTRIASAGRLITLSKQFAARFVSVVTSYPCHADRKRRLGVNQICLRADSQIRAAALGRADGLDRREKVCIRALKAQRGGIESRRDTVIVSVDQARAHMQQQGRRSGSDRSSDAWSEAHCRCRRQS